MLQSRYFFKPKRQKKKVLQSIVCCFMLTKNSVKVCMKEKAECGLLLCLYNRSTREELFKVANSNNELYVPSSCSYVHLTLFDFELPVNTEYKIFKGLSQHDLSATKHGVQRQANTQWRPVSPQEIQCQGGFLSRFDTLIGP